MMTMRTELLYWHKFKDKIHDDDPKHVTYDKDLPERAKKSYEAWKKQRGT